LRAILILFAVVLTASLAAWAQTRGGDTEEGSQVQCANLVYAVSKSSICFSDRFLRRLHMETNIRTQPAFVRAYLDSDTLYRYPFAIMTGEGGFTLTPKERLNLRYYVTSGGFLLASAGCSDPGWTRSFRREIAQIFPKGKLQPIPLTHALYHTVYAINAIRTRHDRRGAQLEGLFHNGKIVVLFSPDGLNDTAHARNCCCCGGDELDQAEHLNVNILAYALLH
jgi:hypothetical protein